MRRPLGSSGVCTFSIMSLCKVAQLFGDDTAVKEYNLSVVLVNSQRDVGVFDTD